MKGYNLEESELWPIKVKESRMINGEWRKAKRELAVLTGQLGMNRKCYQKCTDMRTDFYGVRNGGDVLVAQHAHTVCGLPAPKFSGKSSNKNGKNWEEI